MRISERNGRLVVDAPPRKNRLSAELAIVIADPALAARLAGAIAALSPVTAPLYPRVVLRSRAAVRALRPGELSGKIAVLSLRPAHARDLAELLATVRTATPLGIQLVLDADAADATRARAAVFSALEEARGKRGCPLALARTTRPSFALRLSIMHSLPEAPSPC